MTRVFIAAIVSVLIAIAAWCAFAADQNPGDRPSGMAGIYLMQGRGFGPADAPYEGTCTLTGSGPLYEVSCFNEATRHTYVGRGLAEGGTLAIAIGDRLQGDHRDLYVGEYLVLYTRQPDGRLEGIWTDVRGTIGREMLTPLD